MRRGMISAPPFVPPMGMRFPGPPPMMPGLPGNMPSMPNSPQPPGEQFNPYSPQLGGTGPVGYQGESGPATANQALLHQAALQAMMQQQAMQTPPAMQSQPVMQPQPDMQAQLAMQAQQAAQAQLAMQAYIPTAGPMGNPFAVQPQSVQGPAYPSAQPGTVSPSPHPNGLLFPQERPRPEPGTGVYRMGMYTTKGQGENYSTRA